MRKFKDIEKELGLKKFLASELGTLYFVPFTPNTKGVIVRRFDRKLAPTQVSHFIEIINECNKWIKKDMAISTHVTIEIPFEVGEDFYARIHHIYTVSTESYTEEHNPPEEPEDIHIIRNTITESLQRKFENNREEIIKSILKKSLIEPSAKTYFDDLNSILYVVEPKITLRDIENW